MEGKIERISLTYNPCWLFRASLTKKKEATRSCSARPLIGSVWKFLRISSLTDQDHYESMDRSGAPAVIGKAKEARSLPAAAKGSECGYVQ